MLNVYLINTLREFKCYLHTLTVTLFFNLKSASWAQLQMYSSPAKILMRTEYTSHNPINQINFDLVQFCALNSTPMSVWFWATVLCRQIAGPFIYSHKEPPAVTRRTRSPTTDGLIPTEHWCQLPEVSPDFKEDTEDTETAWIHKRLVRQNTWKKQPAKILGKLCTKST